MVDTSKYQKTLNGARYFKRVSSDMVNWTAYSEVPISKEDAISIQKVEGYDIFYYFFFNFNQIHSSNKYITTWSCYASRN